MQHSNHFNQCQLEQKNDPACFTSDTLPYLYNLEEHIEKSQSTKYVEIGWMTAKRDINVSQPLKGVNTKKWRELFMLVQEGEAKNNGMKWKHRLDSRKNIVIV